MAVSDLGAGDPSVSERRDARKRKLFESLREREFYSYYESVLAYAHTEPQYCDLNSPEAVAEHRAIASADATLTALVQLAALRIGTRRALISFLDAEYSYIIAESTQTLSLQDGSHGPDDALWLGFTKIPRGSSVWEGATDLLSNEGSNARDPRSASIAHIINDLTKDTRFRDEPYVKGGPEARFYAGVPITTLRGISIGVLCLLDDKPRDGLEPSQVEFLQSMASTVMSHLELVLQTVH
jgi:GAF domain-containing protein